MWSIFLPRLCYSGIEFIFFFPDYPVVLPSVPGCVLSPHRRKDHRTSPRNGVGLDCSSSQLHIQEDSSFLENRDWHNCLYLANSSFKIHSFDLFGYEIAARQQNRNHQWKFFLQEGRWFNWPWNWELLLRVSCPLSWEFKWKKQENRVQIVANPSTSFFWFHRKQEVSLSVAQISCLKGTATETIVSLAQKTLHKWVFQSEQNSSSAPSSLWRTALWALLTNLHFHPEF